VRFRHPSNETGHKHAPGLERWNGIHLSHIRAARECRGASHYYYHKTNDTHETERFIITRCQMSVRTLPLDARGGGHCPRLRAGTFRAESDRKGQGAGEEPLRTDEESGEQAGCRQVPPHETRHSRRRFLLLAGAVVAGFVGVLELFRRLGGSGSDVTGAAAQSVATVFSSFPINAVEHIPNRTRNDWTLKNDPSLREVVNRPCCRRRPGQATPMALQRRVGCSVSHRYRAWVASGSQTASFGDALARSGTHLRWCVAL